MVRLDLGNVQLEGHLRRPANADRLAVFVHGSGSSRHSPRNNHVAERLEQKGIASLLFDLLTEDEDSSRRTRFDIDLLTERVRRAIGWAVDRAELSELPVHLFGASTGAAAAIRAAAEDHTAMRSVVSRGGRPDLAGDALERVRVPCLLIVGGEDEEVLRLNRYARSRMNAPSDLRVVEGATHLFEEPGALDRVADHAEQWIREH